MSEEALERRNGGTMERGNDGTAERGNDAGQVGGVVPSCSRFHVPSFPRSVVPPEPLIIAESPAMRRAVELARRFAPLDLPVLLVGETGTGKEVIAQAIHRWSGRRGELVDVDCGALAPGMVVNELFGHRRGAYTSAMESSPGLMERANHGTLFLDELVSLPTEGQAALLRALETGEVRRVGDLAKIRLQVRLIAAIQDELISRLQDRRLRVDLYQRLAGGVIYLPPLRTRPEDLWPLAGLFAQLAGRRLDGCARQALERHSWPGNVRELQHVMVRAVCLSNADQLGAAVVAEAIDLGVVPGERRMSPANPEELRVAARSELEMLCREHGGDVEAMAAALRVSRSTLYRRLQRVGLRLNEMLGS